MKKHSWKILSLILILYFGFELFKEYHPTFYGTSFNDERIKIGLVPIDSTLIKKGENTYVYQSWKNESENVPRFYAKYASFDKWNKGIEMENDNYVVMVDSLKTIVSINYNFRTKKFNYELKEYNRPKNTSDLYGHSGKTIRVLTKNETAEILNNNGIKY
ncbi:hypothetical protein BWZ20_00245 [Winogradskyella sp. J14-2]|uniref:hypothetical protein n=1 Tax=Winogradskyella sp. J14-2 TaxID=1936080 RepID=UPI000972CF81|nr:hypothetical protein [Winogradskyella sp. J14-2]APY06818.1 hypothetical protein BWZ20_00245 [Winogradskyella sp. J14-2]